MPKAVYAVRVEDLIDGRRVGCECLACGHLSEIEVIAIKRKANPNMLLKQLRYSMRCRRCDSAGRVRLIIGYAIGNEVRPDLAIEP